MISQSRSCWSCTVCGEGWFVLNLETAKAIPATRAIMFFAARDAESIRLALVTRVVIISAVEWRINKACFMIG